MKIINLKTNEVNQNNPLKNLNPKFQMIGNMFKKIDTATHYLLAALRFAIKDPNAWIEDIEKLLNNPSVDANFIYDEGNAPIHIICQNKSIQLLELILKYKVNVNLGNKQNDTPLHIAAMENWIEGVQILLNHNADVNAKNAAAAANNLFLNNIYFTLSFKLILA